MSFLAEEGQAGAPLDEKALAQQEDTRIRTFAIAQARHAFPCVWKTELLVIDNGGLILQYAVNRHRLHA